MEKELRNPQLSLDGINKWYKVCDLFYSYFSLFFPLKIFYSYQVTNDVCEVVVWVIKVIQKLDSWAGVSYEILSSPIGRFGCIIV